jgi:hypothetical protein
MTNVLSEIERQKRIEQAHTWDANEKAIAKRMIDRVILEAARRQKDPDAFVELQAEPSQVDEMTWKDFVAFAEREGVRHLPAKSQTIACYLLDGSITHEQALDVLAVIARRHDNHGLSNPCATAGVRAVLELMFDDQPPRSWKRAEMELWSRLPEDIRYAISRRERERERVVRLAQQEAADLRNEKKNAESKTEENPTRQTTASDQDSRTAVGM